MEPAVIKINAANFPPLYTNHAPSSHLFGRSISLAVTARGSMRVRAGCHVVHRNPAPSLSSLLFGQKTCCSAVAFLETLLKVLFNVLCWPVAPGPSATESIVTVPEVECVCVCGGGGGGGMTLQQWQLAAQLAGAISSQWRAFPRGPVI